MSQPRKKFWSWLVGGGVLIVCAAFGFYRWKIAQSEQISYTPHTITRGDLRVEILATGKVQPSSRLEVKPPINGRIEEVKVLEGQKVQKGQVLAYMSSTDRAALLDLAAGKGGAEVAKLTEVFRPTPLVAPLSGLVIARNVQPGQIITSAEAAFILSDRPIVVAQIDETDLGSVKLGQDVEITLDAYANQPFMGKVQQIAFESRTVSNVTVYDVKIGWDKDLDFIRAGLTANVKFRTAERENVVLVPMNLTKTVEGHTTVLVPAATKPNEKPQPPEIREIELGLNDGKNAEVVKGLQEGDVVLEVSSDAELTKDKQGSNNPFMPFGGGRRPRRH